MYHVVVGNEAMLCNNKEVAAAKCCGNNCIKLHSLNSYKHQSRFSLTRKTTMAKHGLQLQFQITPTNAAQYQ